MSVRDWAETRKTIERLLAERILVIDGAMGTMVHALKLTGKDFHGERFAGHSKDLTNFIDILSITQPDAIEGIHRQYLEAGADIIETNTFSAGTRVALAHYGLESLVREINLAGARLARRAVDGMNQRTPDKPRFVAGSIGPTNKQLSIAGNLGDPGHRDVTFDQMMESYYEQVEALVDGGVDLLLVETAFDTLVFKSALFAIQKYMDDHGVRLPVMASFTVFQGGRTLSGQTVEACWNSISNVDLLSVGINCARTGNAAAVPGGVIANCADLFELLSECRIAERIWRLR
jgi:5-methyltetrahydrofolate--homocysteine methyltransferase